MSRPRARKYELALCIAHVALRSNQDHLLHTKFGLVCNVILSLGLHLSFVTVSKCRFWFIGLPGPWRGAQEDAKVPSPQLADPHISELTVMCPMATHLRAGI